MYYKNSPTSVLFPLHTLDENKMLALHEGIVISIENSMHIIK
jgi:hypothetical protein